MKRKAIGLIMLVLLCVAVAHTDAQELSLPTDLLFAEDIGEKTVIARIDATTFAKSIFYDAPNLRSATPIVWSPDGQKLLISQWLIESDVIQLCLITREGAFLRCLEDTPYLNGEERTNTYQHDIFSWSNDSQKVYFASIKDEIIRLIEADARTGKTLNIIHSIPVVGQDSYERGYLSWTSDMRFVGEYFGMTLSSTIPTTIHDKQRSSQQAIRSPQNMSSKLFAAHICLQISPKGSYLVAISFNGSAIYLLNRQGDIVDTLGGYEGFYGNCPVWNADEKSFLYVYDGVQRYTLATRQSTTLHRPYIENGKKSISVLYPLVPSPDGSFIAARGGYKTGDYLIAVIYPYGAVRQLSERFSYSPVWVPPLP